MGFTKALARWIVDLRFEDLPAAVVPWTKAAVTDYFAVGLAGCPAPGLTIVREHALRATPFHQAAVWPYGDFNFNRGYDVASSTIRLRQSGFAECADTGEMFLNHFTRFRKQRLIP